MFGITGDMFGGFVRAIVSPAIAYAAGKGMIGGDQAAPIITGIVMFGTAVWSGFTNRPAKVVAVPGTGPAIATGTIDK